jgi:hypothetical protein
MDMALRWYAIPPADDAARAEKRLWRTGVLSLLVHGALAVLLIPHVRDWQQPGPEAPQESQPLSVAIVAPPSPQVAPSVPAPALAPPPAPRREARPQPPQPRPTPPPMAAIPRVPDPEALRVPPPVVEPLPEPAPTRPRLDIRPPAPPPVEGDLSSYIASRRAARGETPSAPSVAAPARESDAARRERAIAQNLAGLNEPRALTGNPRNGGGLFQITLKSYDFAEFRFYGWSPEIQRQAPQRIEVRKGSNPSIDVAIVRRMIQIIRETQKGDFVWRSDRQGRDITLSARPEDNERLERFLMDEMFGPPLRPPTG